MSDENKIRMEIEILPDNEPRKLKIGWKVNETTGPIIINPMIFVNERVNMSVATNEKEIILLFKECVDIAPSRITRIIEMIEHKYPQFADVINKWKILI